MNWLQFTSPLALWALLALPIIWWLLRATPPRPIEQAFPPLRILMQLKRPEETPDKTPWWLLLLRLMMAALVIFAVAHPFSRGTQLLNPGNGPLLLVLDDGWAAAPDWAKRQEALLDILSEAEGRLIYFATTANPEKPESQTAEATVKKLRALIPQALPTNRSKLAPLLQALAPAPADAIWLTDGLAAQDASSFAATLRTIAPLQIIDLPAHQTPSALGQPVLANGDITLPVFAGKETAGAVAVQALAGDGRILAESKIELASETTRQAKLSLPAELRNAIQSIVLSGPRSAATTQLLDDSWRRKTVALMSGETTASGQPLLEASHYLVTALANQAEIITPANSTELRDALSAGLSMLILSDIGQLPPEDHDTISDWIKKGGLLLRFAGPKLAAAADDLLPVKLHAGDRNLGSSLSWEQPQSIRPFADQGPFAGLVVDPKAMVARQVLAEPEADLSERTWASLTDGTPLITASKLGNGRIVLFHTTANADWSNLPLTGTFAAVMQRLAELAPAAGDPKSASSATATGDYAPRLLLNGFGELISPQTDAKPIAAKDIGLAKASIETPAGLYSRSLESRAVNLRLQQSDLAPLPTDLAVKPFKPAETVSYATPLFLLTTLLFILDGLAMLWIGGFTGRSRAPAALLIALMLLPPVPPAKAVDPPLAALQTQIAFVKTGDEEIDGASEAGLKSLGRVIAQRSSTALGEPAGVNVENDELVFYPLIYWPVTPEAESLSPKARAKVSGYMKNGGTIFFDLREPAGQPGEGPTGQALRRILTNIDIPPLEPIPPGHVLGKSFYLLKDFPGRYEGGTLWVETSDDPQSAGFDNVSGLIIGTNDYAAAWAVNERGQGLYALVPGSARQREMAWRVGLNLVMYVLTGNYKTDQVHVPMILERLGKS